MLKVFFISILIVTTKPPAEGWIQWSQAYTDREVCMSSIADNHEAIEQAARNYMGEVVESVKEFRCLTYQEAVELNSKLGH